MASQEFSDYIGAESCADLKSEVDRSPPRGAGISRLLMRPRGETTGKEYPPPISQPSRMPPWVMKKYYAGDGRLIITAEKVRRHEYLQAQRSNGRLVLYLVPLDDAIEGSCEEQYEYDSDEEEMDGGEESDQEIHRGDEIGESTTVEEAVSECCKYNGKGRTTPCGGLAAAVAAALRPPFHT